MPATGQVFKLDGPHTDRTLVQAAVSDSSSLVSKSIREGKFRSVSVYNAGVFAVAGTAVDEQVVARLERLLQAVKHLLAIFIVVHTPC